MISKKPKANSCPMETPTLAVMTHSKEKLFPVGCLAMLMYPNLSLPTCSVVDDEPQLECSHRSIYIRTFVDAEDCRRHSG